MRTHNGMTIGQLIEFQRKLKEMSLLDLAWAIVDASNEMMSASTLAKHLENVEEGYLLSESIVRQTATVLDLNPDLLFALDGGRIQLDVIQMIQTHPTRLSEIVRQAYAQLKEEGVPDETRIAY